MLCSRCGQPDLPKQTTVCPNCGFKLRKKIKVIDDDHFISCALRAA